MDPIETEVEIGLIELEQLAQQAHQLVESLAYTVFSHRVRIGTAYRLSPKPARSSTTSTS